MSPASKLISLIHRSPWATDMFPEFKDNKSKSAFINQLTVFLSQSQKENVKNQTAGVLAIILSTLDNEKIRQNFLQDDLHLDTSIPLNAALLCAIAYNIAEIHTRQKDDVHFCENAYKTAYGVSIHHDYLTQCENELRRLIEAPPEVQQTASFLFDYAKSNQWTALRTLLKGLINPNDADMNQKTALHHAAEHESIECMEILLAHPKIDVLLKDKTGKVAYDYLPARKDEFRWQGKQHLIKQLQPSKPAVIFSQLSQVTISKPAASEGFCKIM